MDIIITKGADADGGTREARKGFKLGKGNGSVTVQYDSTEAAALVKKFVGA